MSPGGGKLKFPKLVPAIFIKRNNRFTAGVRLQGGGLTTAFIPTTGRLTSALNPGCQVWLEAAANPNRKTPYSLVLTELPRGGLCSVNAILANKVFKEALQQHELAEFDYEKIESEVPFEKSRLDFRLSSAAQTCWVEVKSVTYAEDGIGKFPDAPTQRGRKHLRELVKLAKAGDRVSVVFIAQREDAQHFMPFKEIDPEFAETLCKVHQAGVEVHAYRCAVRVEGVTIAEEIPAVPCVK